MAKAKQVTDEMNAFLDKVLRATALYVQGEMKRMTPVDTGALRTNVQMTVDDKVARVFNNLPYAERVYLEGHSNQLPKGEFQAFVASIPQRADAIARGLR